MLAAVTCLSSSVMYHTLMNHSQNVENFCLRLDMVGIVIFILGDLVLGIYLMFWCEPVLRSIYWSIVRLSLCIFSFVISDLVPDSDSLFSSIDRLEFSGRLQFL